MEVLAPSQRRSASNRKQDEETFLRLFPTNAEGYITRSEWNIAVADGLFPFLDDPNEVLEHVLDEHISSFMNRGENRQFTIIVSLISIIITVFITTPICHDF